VKEPIIEAVKTSDPESNPALGIVPVVEVGDRITYYITLTNSG